MSSSSNQSLAAQTRARAAAPAAVAPTNKEQAAANTTTTEADEITFRMVLANATVIDNVSYNTVAAVSVIMTHQRLRTEENNYAKLRFDNHSRNEAQNEKNGILVHPGTIILISSHLLNHKTSTRSSSAGHVVSVDIWLVITCLMASSVSELRQRPYGFTLLNYIC